MDAGYACYPGVPFDIPKAFGIRVTVMVSLSNHVYTTNYAHIIKMEGIYIG
jgi:hypothetical protein